jgi:hypothetical protein
VPQDATQQDASPQARSKRSAQQRGAQQKPKNDPKLIAAARELRDRYLEHVNSDPAALPAGDARYDVSRQIDPPDARSPVPLSPVPQSPRPRPVIARPSTPLLLDQAA